MADPVNCMILDVGTCVCHDATLSEVLSIVCCIQYASRHGQDSTTRALCLGSSKESMCVEQHVR